MPSVLIIKGLSENSFGAEDVFTVTLENELKRKNIVCSTVSSFDHENYAVTGVGERNLIYAVRFLSGEGGASEISVSDDDFCYSLAVKLKSTRKCLTFINGILPDNPLKCCFPLLFDSIDRTPDFCPYEEALKTAKIISETL